MAQSKKRNIFGNAIYQGWLSWRESRVGIMCEAFRNGSNITDACAFAKISRDTYYDWIKKYPDISYKFEAAQADMIITAQATLRKGITYDPKLAFDYLKSKRSIDFTPQKVALEGSLVLHDETSPNVAAAVAAGVGEALKKLNADANKD